MESRERASHNEDGSMKDRLDKLADDIRRIPSRRKAVLESLMKKKLYDLKETAAILGITVPAVRAAIKKGRIKTLHVGRFVRIQAEELENVIEKEEGYISTREASGILGVTALTIRALIGRGELKAVRFLEDGPYKIPLSEVERLMKRGSQ